MHHPSRGALAGTRNSSMGPPHEESIRRPIKPLTGIDPGLKTYQTGIVLTPYIERRVMQSVLFTDFTVVRQSVTCNDKYIEISFKYSFHQMTQAWAYFKTSQHLFI